MSTTPPIRWRRTLAVLAVAPLVLAAAACGGESSAEDNSSGSDSSNAGAVADELRLGYFANVTHAPAAGRRQEGFFEEELGRHRRSRPRRSTPGRTSIEAMFAGAWIDASYIGPNPAINGFVQIRRARSVRIIAGATSGGARSIVRATASTPRRLIANKKVATPQLGNTQDVALRTWLPTNGLERDEQGGNVPSLPTPNADS